MGDSPPNLLVAIGHGAFATADAIVHVPAKAKSRGSAQRVGHHPRFCTSAGDSRALVFQGQGHALALGGFDNGFEEGHDHIEMLFNAGPIFPIPLFSIGIPQGKASDDRCAQGVGEFDHAVKYALVLGLFPFAVVRALAHGRADSHHGHVVLCQHIPNALQVLIVNFLNALAPYPAAQLDPGRPGFCAQSHGRIKIGFVDFIGKIAQFHFFLLSVSKWRAKI